MLSILPDSNSSGINPGRFSLAMMIRPLQVRPANERDLPLSLTRDSYIRGESTDRNTNGTPMR